jgi:hypothetical protein
MRGAGKVYYKEFSATKPTSFQTRAQTVAGENYVMSLESGAMTRYKVPRASYELQSAKINRELAPQPEFQALSKADKVREVERIIAERQDSSAIINRNPYVSLTQYGTVKTTDGQVIPLKGIDVADIIKNDKKGTVASISPTNANEIKNVAGNIDQVKFSTIPGTNIKRGRLSVADRPKVLMKIADEKGIASVDFYPFLSRAVKENKVLDAVKVERIESKFNKPMFQTTEQLGTSKVFNLGGGKLPVDIKNEVSVRNYFGGEVSTVATANQPRVNLFATGLQRTYVFDKKGNKVLSKSRQKIQLFKNDLGQDILVRGAGKKQKTFDFESRNIEDNLGEIVTTERMSGDVTKSIVAQKFPRKDNLNFDTGRDIQTQLETGMNTDAPLRLYVGRTNLPATKGVAPSRGIIRTGRDLLGSAGSTLAEGTLLGANKLVKAVSNIQKRPRLQSSKKGSLSSYGGFDTFMPDQPNNFVEQFTAPSTLVQETKATAPMLQVVQQPSQLIGTATKSNFESMINPRFAPANKLNVKTRPVSGNNLRAGLRSAFIEQTQGKTGTSSINDAMNQSMNIARNQYLTKAQNLAINQVGIKPMDLTTPKIGTSGRTRTSTITQTEAIAKPKAVAPKSPGITMPKIVVPRPVIPVEPEPLPILLLDGDSKSFKTKGLKRKKSNIDAWTQFRPSLYAIATGQKQSEKVGKYNVKSYGFEFRF